MITHHALEFTLGEERYCIDVEYVTDVVSRSKRDETSIPESPPHVEGKIHLRGETTRVIDPTTRLLPAGNEVLRVDSESVGAVDGELINRLVAGEDGQTVRGDPELISAET